MPGESRVDRVVLPRGLSICFAPDVLVNAANPQTPPQVEPRNLSLPIRALGVYSSCLHVLKGKLKLSWPKTEPCSP